VNFPDYHRNTQRLRQLCIFNALYPDHSRRTHHRCPATRTQMQTLKLQQLSIGCILAPTPPSSDLEHDCRASKVVLAACLRALNDYVQSELQVTPREAGLVGANRQLLGAYSSSSNMHCRLWHSHQSSLQT
jgi:hypothetical protein